MILKELLETLDYDYSVKSIGLYKQGINSESELITKKVDANPGEILQHSHHKVIKWYPGIFDTTNKDIYGKEYDAKFVRLIIVLDIEENN